MVTVRRLLHESSMRLGGRVDAEALLLHVIGQSRAWLFAHAGDALDMDVQTAFQALVARRAAGEPVAYLTGRRGFWTLELEVTPATLIPRPETELLVELALQRLPHDAATPVADLGTGSGAVALAIASERAYATVVATDASPEALAVAGRNAQRLGVANVRFIHGDWLAPLGNERFALIVSNPPYIEASDPHLAQGDLRYEPVSALASGPDGLRDIRHIIAGADAHLESGGWLLLEHGWNQGEAVRALLCAAGFQQVFTAQDLEKRDRVSGGRREG